MSVFLKDLLSGAKPLATYTKVATYMGILLPNTLVTPIRYFVANEKKDVRVRLMYRDALAGGLGIVAFYLTRGLASPIFRTIIKRPKPVIDMLATLVGWIGNVALQGVGAVKMAEWLSKYSQQQQAAPSVRPHSSVYPTSAGRLHQSVYQTGRNYPTSASSLRSTYSLQYEKLPTGAPSITRSAFLSPNPLSR